MDFFDRAVFDLLFNSADLSKFAKEDKIKYVNNMTTERDIRNQIDYARHEGREEGKEEATLTMAKNCKAEGLPVEMIVKLTGLSEEVIKAL